MPTVRDAAVAFWRAALAAGDVAPLIARHLRVHGSRLTAADASLDLTRLQRVLVLGVGKAGGAVAQAAENILGHRISGGVGGVKGGYPVPTKRIEVTGAGHPVPAA